MYYGWKLLGVLGSIYFLSIGTVFYGFAVTLPEMIDTFGWSRSEVGLGFSIMTLSMGLSGPLIAWVISRVGARFSIMLGGIIAAAGGVNMYFADTLLQFYLGTAPLLGIGIGLQTIIPGTHLVSNWFKKRRAMAIGLFMASGGLGRAIITPLFALIIEQTGDWRIIWLIMAGCTLAASFLAFLMVKNSPQEMGLNVDGADDTADGEEEEESRNSKVFQTEVDWPVKPALKTSSFWMLVGCSAIAVMGGTLINSQGLLHLHDIGFDKVTAASAIGLIGFLSTGGRLVSGALGDYLEPKYLMGLGLFMLLVGMVLLSTATTPIAIYTFACVFGLGNGLALVTTPTIMANYFGSLNYASLYAVRGLSTTCLSATVPVAAGYIFDEFHSYGPIFIGYIGLAAFAIVLVIFLKPPVISKEVAAGK
ncbi:MAG: MFS transporter [Pseudomonadales bacterium]|nr:MFS transporter [Pseudomonadales bacterium]